MPDHIHIFISSHPKYSPMDIVKKLKGVSAKLIFQKYPQFKQKEFWGSHLWSEGYYVGTAGVVTTEAIRKYIDAFLPRRSQQSSGSSRRRAGSAGRVLSVTSPRRAQVGQARWVPVHDPRSIPSLHDGSQTAYFGSSEDMQEVPEGTVRLAFTSPPYWDLKDYQHPGQIGQEPYEAYLARMNRVWDECYRVTASNGLLFINVGNRRVKKEFYPLGMDIYRKMRELGSKWRLLENFIWYVPNALPQPNHYIERLFDNKYENVLCFAKNYDYDYVFNKIRVKQKWQGVDPRQAKLNPKGRCISNVIRIPAYRPPPIKKMNYHVAAFPDELVQVFIHAFSNRADIVLDPFLGSGTVLKVAKAMGRNGIGYEVNPDFRAVIEARLHEPWEPVPFEKVDLIHSVIPDARTHIAIVGRRRPPQNGNGDTAEPARLDAWTKATP